MQHNGCNWLTSLFHNLQAALSIPTGPQDSYVSQQDLLQLVGLYTAPSVCATLSAAPSFGDNGTWTTAPSPKVLHAVGGQGLPQQISYPAGLWTPPPMLTTSAAQLPQSAMMPHPPGLAPQDVHKQLEDMRQQLMAFLCMFQSGLDHKAETVSQAQVQHVPTPPALCPHEGFLTVEKQQPRPVVIPQEYNVRSVRLRGP